MVAIQLGLLDDAERLYIECGRYDLLNQLYQASGQVRVRRARDGGLLLLLLLLLVLLLRLLLLLLLGVLLVLLL